MAISKLFDERPIWPKRGLIERLLHLGLEFPDSIFRRLSSLKIVLIFIFHVSCENLPLSNNRL